MQLEVRIFGAAAVRCGSDTVTVGVGDRPTARDVLDALRDQHPVLRFALPEDGSGRLAVNQAFAAAADEIGPGDEVALITLVGGG